MLQFHCLLFMTIWQRKENEILMYHTIDMYLWILYRRFHGMPVLRREDDYIVARSEDRRNFEEFRELVLHSKYPKFSLPGCPLLLEYM